jgi:hypothetical protein
MWNYAPCTQSAGAADFNKLPLPKGWDIVGSFTAPPPPGFPSDSSLPFGMLLKVRGGTATRLILIFLKEKSGVAVVAA